VAHAVGTARLVIKYFSLVEKFLQHDIETLICVALTHDLLEDTRTDASHLEEVAGVQVRTLVESLTKPPAGVVGKTKDDRNREFADRIASAGPGAVFVKLCDSLHNMSRPQSTPQRLFLKIVEKSLTQYLPLLERCPLGPEFAEIYAQSLAEATDAGTLEEQVEQPSGIRLTFEEALRECVESAAGKILELHDIAEVIERVFEASSVIIWLKHGKEKDILKVAAASKPDVVHETSFQMKNMDSVSFLSGKALRRFQSSVQGSEDSAVLAIPMEIGSEKSFLVAVLFRAAVPPSWLTLDAATLMVQFLAHRLILSEADRGSIVATEAARLGVQLDVDLATYFGISSVDLLRLENWRRRCRQAIEVVQHLVHSFLLGNVELDSFRQLIRVESRLKTVNSVLRKMKHRDGGAKFNFEEVEDVAGVRVICPTLACMTEIESYLLGEKAVSVGCRLHRQVENPRRDYITQPTTAGYRGLHLILEVDTYIREEGSTRVPCEVQLRTMFQDLWANIAHDTLYRASSENSVMKARLREIGEALKHCEELSEGLFGECVRPYV